jgi:hypothetical protein
MLLRRLCIVMIEHVPPEPGARQQTRNLLIDLGLDLSLE